MTATSHRCRASDLRVQSCRYATYKATQKQPGGQQLVAFTRILHRTKPDILYNEVSPQAQVTTLQSCCSMVAYSS